MDLPFYRGPDFLAVVGFGSSPPPLPPPLSPVNKLDGRHKWRLRETTCWRESEGRGWTRSRIIRPRESLVLCKSFNTLCFRFILIRTERKLTFGGILTCLSMSRAQSTYTVRGLPNYWPPTPSPPSECVLPPPPRTKGGVYTLAGRWGGWGSIFQYFGRRQILDWPHTV